MTTAQRWSRRTWGALAVTAAVGLLVGCGAVGPTSTAPTAAETGPPAASTGGSGPCGVNAVMDLVQDFQGEPTAGDALERWLDGPRGNPAADPVAVPEGVPADGWVAEAAPAGDPTGQDRPEQIFTSGGWRVSVAQSSNGSWLVTRFSCTGS